MYQKFQECCSKYVLENVVVSFYEKKPFKRLKRADERDFQIGIFIKHYSDFQIDSDWLLTYFSSVAQLTPLKTYLSLIYVNIWQMKGVFF